MKVDVVETTMVAPSEATPRRMLWLSNLDLALTYYPRPDPSSGDAAEAGSSPFFEPARLRDALARALVPFHLLAGRLAMGPEGRAEIDCNGDEVFRDFEPSPEARRLFVPFAESGEPPCVLAMVQLTFLKCGNVVVGTGMHHWAMDGAGAFQFIRTWTALARGESPPDVSPFHDRTLLRARSPPHVPFEHPVYSPSYLTGVPRPFVTRMYVVPPKLLADIKSCCAEEGASTYSAVTAHLWRAMCVARGLPCQAATARPGSASPSTSGISTTFLGNAIIRDLVTVKVGDVLSRPLGFVADLIKRAVSRVDDAFVRSVIDCLELELEKGSQAARGQFMPESDLWVAIWLGLPIYDADFGWGRPGFVAPAQMQGSGTAYVTQGPDGEEDPVTVIFALEPEYLHCFEKAFYGE